MELPAKIQSLLKIDAQGFVCCSGKEMTSVCKSLQLKDAIKILDVILDTLGALSAKAQALKQIITNSIKFGGTEHRIYIKINQNKALGFIKVGEKNLFYRDFLGNIKELKATCILDFYVHESCQRSGIGKEIFQKFLKNEGRTPDKLAYDRPSQKLIGFLKKHYGLVKYIPQNNNYVIFDRYFSKEPFQKVETIVESLKKQPIVAPTIQSSYNIQDNQVFESSRLRPKSQLPGKEIKMSEMKVEEKSEAKREFKEFQTAFQSKMMPKHKNATSEGNPLSVPLTENLAFRTTSHSYGNHYQRKL